MSETTTGAVKRERWAEFRFSIIGGLLAAPPSDYGGLKEQLKKLGSQNWIHPIEGRPFQVSWYTIERWYYRAKRSSDSPVRSLARHLVKGPGTGHKMSPELVKKIADLYDQYPHWTYLLHYDNLVVLCRENLSIGPMPSYSTLIRYFKQQGFTRKKIRKKFIEASEALSMPKHSQREIRSFEVDYVGSLWHADFHHGSFRVLGKDGRWIKPMCLAICDDHSRLACHVQWYETEQTEDLVHGLSQALMKRGMPGAFMTDNGAAMMSEEFKSGLLKLGIQHDTSLPYCPYQNGKVEKFWANLEGRLMAMLTAQRDLTLDLLNDATCAWVEMEYNCRVHDEIKMTPRERFSSSKSVLKPALLGEQLREAFRLKIRRKIRKTDMSVCIEGRRFEIPSVYRCLETAVIAYARWDFGFMHLIDERSGDALCRLYPVDKSSNAEGMRRVVSQETAPQESGVSSELPPLLSKLMADFSETGLPFPYMKKHQRKELNNES